MALVTLLIVVVFGVLGMGLGRAFGAYQNNNNEKRPTTAGALGEEAPPEQLPSPAGDTATNAASPVEAEKQQQEESEIGELEQEVASAVVEEPPPTSNPPPSESSLAGLGDFSATTTQQINSFRNGEGILMNFNIAHHGATAVCAEFKQDLTYPHFSCIHPTAEDGVSGAYPDYMPWTYDDTEKNIQIVRQYFQFISWPFLGPPRQHMPQIADMDWENPHLVSLFVARDPLSRALAGDGTMAAKYPNIWKYHNGTHEEWWQFAHEETHTNNFAVWVLSNYTCCDGAKTSPHYLEMAKELVQRFSFVLDINCLEYGLEKVAEILGFSLRHPPKYSDDRHHHAPVKERIPFPEVYEYLKEKNKLDIELYEWTKSLALVDCDSVIADETAEEQESVAAAAERPPQSESSPP